MRGLEHARMMLTVSRRDLRAIEFLEQSGEGVPGKFHALMHLTDFAIQFRYEPLVYLDAGLNRTELTKHVAEVIAHVKKLIQDLEEAD